MKLSFYYIFVTFARAVPFVAEAVREDDCRASLTAEIDDLVDCLANEPGNADGGERDDKSSYDSFGHGLISFLIRPTRGEVDRLE